RSFHCHTTARPHNSANCAESSTLFRSYGCAFRHPVVCQLHYRRGKTHFTSPKPTTSVAKGARYVMDRHGTKHVDIPKWSALLVEAVNKPGMIMEAYSAFHSYSIGNQILALVQCQLRGLEPGPLNTFPGWQALGRTVKRGERALILCMPVTRKVREDEAQEANESDEGNGKR